MSDRTPPTTLIWVRHAPATPPGHLYGRRDVAADCSDDARFARQRKFIGAVDALVTSPARRCRQTLETLWPDATTRPPIAVMESLWEQDFGTWEGKPFAELPSLPEMSAPHLATHRPPDGESFAELYRRIAGSIDTICATYPGGTVGIVAHAGVIRAALAKALDGHPGRGLVFSIDTLSVTRLRRFGPNHWAIDKVNG